jgi:hypothetical protein
MTRMTADRSDSNCGAIITCVDWTGRFTISCSKCGVSESGYATEIVAEYSGWIRERSGWRIDFVCGHHTALWQECLGKPTV